MHERPLTGRKRNALMHALNGRTTRHDDTNPDAALKACHLACRSRLEGRAGGAHGAGVRKSFRLGLGLGQFVHDWQIACLASAERADRAKCS